MKIIIALFLVSISAIAMANTSDTPCGGLFTKLDEFTTLKPGDDVWKVYTCKTCNNPDASMKPNAAGQAGCNSCGSPHTDEPAAFAIQKGADGKDTIRNSDRLAGKEEKVKHSSGNRWSCSFCQTSNFKSDIRCLSCGADSGDKKTLTLNQTGARPKPKPTSTPTSVPAPASSRSSVLPIAGGAVAVAAVGGGAYWALSTKEYLATVTSLRWAHQYKVERFTKVTLNGFKVDVSESEPIMPLNGSGERAGAYNFRNCYLEIHHYTPEYKCGTRKVTKTRPKTVDDGQDCGIKDNGSGGGTYTCTPRTKVIQEEYEDDEDVMCKDPVKENKCDYDSFQWQEIDTKVVTGGEAVSSDPLPWPEVALGPVDRKIPGEGYEAEFSYETDKGKAETEKVKLSSEAEFKSYRMTSRVKVFRRNMGGLSKWERLD